MFCAALALGLLPGGAAAAEPARTGAEVVKAFVEGVLGHAEFSAEAREFVRQQWESRRLDQDLRSFIPEMLAVLYPRFKTGLDACGSSQFGYCSRVMGEMSFGGDPYLSTHAAYFQAKALVEDLEFEYATMLLSYVLRDDFDVLSYCLDVADMRFLQGYCLFQMLDGPAAREALESFLSAHPDARAELRAAAREMLVQLDPPPRKDLGLAAHLMADAGLWLTEGQAGLETQTSQKKALMILEEMVRKAEQQENNQQRQQQQRAGGVGGPSRPGSSNVPQAPAEASAVQEGAATSGTLHAAPRAVPGEVWGEMKPQDRERIMQALQMNFPSRYRGLVEQYYKSLAEQE